MVSWLVSRLVGWLAGSLVVLFLSVCGGKIMFAVFLVVRALDWIVIRRLLQ